MDTVSFLLPVALALVAGGLVKGTFGLGLPLVAFSVQALVLIPEKVIFALIGLAIIGIALLARYKPKVQIAPQHERWFGPLCGMIGGLVGGTTTFYGPPLMIYLAGLRLSKDEFVGAISLMYFMGALGMGIGLASFGIADGPVFTQSLVATIPALLGIQLGQMIRVRLNEQRFAKWLFVMYLVIGGSFLLKAIP
jgi:uncharacterized membrane protein YfcA